MAVAGSDEVDSLNVSVATGILLHQLVLNKVPVTEAALAAGLAAGGALSSTAPWAAASPMEASMISGDS